jgi:23S rRNA (pseudouridine1915-N3)-methyltransferase
MERGNSQFNFVIGSSYGLSKTVAEQADLQLSFSAMTFPHQLVRVMLVEQLYRAYKIASGETYHK